MSENKDSEGQQKRVKQSLDVTEEELPTAPSQVVILGFRF